MGLSINPAPFWALGIQKGEGRMVFDTRQAGSSTNLPIKPEEEVNSRQLCTFQTC